MGDRVTLIDFCMYKKIKQVGMQVDRQAGTETGRDRYTYMNFAFQEKNIRNSIYYLSTFREV